MVNPIVPTTEVRKLVIGSYEDLTHRIEEAAFLDRERIFGDGSADRVKVLGTFKGHAIVVNEEGHFAKLFYEIASNGELMLMGREVLNIPIYEGKSGIRRFLMGEASNLVENFFITEPEQITIAIKDLMRSISSANDATDSQIVASYVESAFDTERSWRPLLAERLTPADASVLEAFEPKFLKLSGENIPPEQQEAYRTLVVSDLGTLVSSLDELHSEIGKSVASLTSLIDTHPELSRDESVVELRSAANDLMGDLLNSQHSIVDSLENVSSISALGELHDALALELTRRTIAGKYISQAVAEIASSLNK
jgi:hypothetical protein